jgi:ubiquinone/menaquinone biosynthesis C-methylase UbiE
MPVDPYSGLVDLYDAWFRQNNLLFATELKAIQKIMPPFNRALEIGVGTGRFAQALGVREGLDPSPAMLAKAQERGIKSIVASAEAIPLPDMRYDLALMVTVDCFLKDLPAALNEIHRILKPAAYLVLAMLDKDAPLAAEILRQKTASPFYKDADLHTAAEMRVNLARAGFSVGACYQTVFSLANKIQPVLSGTGAGLFAVLQAKRQ